MAKRTIRRQTRSRRKAQGGSSNSTLGSVRANMLPIFLSGCVLVCLAVIGYLSVTSIQSSDFFSVTNIEVHGSTRSDTEAIERIATSQTAKAGAWNSDLSEIRSRVEKLAFVRAASVSRILPNGVRVEVFEHEPVAIVRKESGDYLVGEDGTVLSKVEGEEQSLPFAMVGWDEQKSEKADKENRERLKLYREMLREWLDHGIAEQVEIVNIASIREPKVTIEDSGRNVSLAVGRDNFGENLNRAIRAISGKGEEFSGVQLVGSNLILEPRQAPKGAGSQ